MPVLNKNLFRYWVQYFILTFIVVAAVAFPLLNQRDKDLLKAEINQDISLILKAEHLLQSMFHERISDIRVLAHHSVWTDSCPSDPGKQAGGYPDDVFCLPFLRGSMIRFA